MERNRRKEFVGKVVSNKMEKSVVVSVDYRKKHPAYRKYIKRSTRLMAHDENNDVNEGDWVRIMETRPLSKNKKWRIAQIIERAK